MIEHSQCFEHSMHHEYSGKQAFAPDKTVDESIRASIVAFERLDRSITKCHDRGYFSLVLI